ncbi:MAG: hypothetical protein NT027_12310, partial [Proteobacteria bacterium]|nr:hypothetical protein [Pseudomonadota bacterium]
MPWSLEFLNRVIYSLALCLASFGSHLAVAQDLDSVESESLPQINDDRASGTIRIVDIIIEGRNNLQKIDLQNLLKIDLASISSRANLDAVISDAEQRLQALSRFSRVEIKLSKSTQPGFYNLTFDLDEFSDFYFGSGALLEYADHYEKSFTIQLYGGTKNLYNTNAMLDVDVQHRQTDYKTSSSTIKN